MWPDEVKVAVHHLFIILFVELSQLPKHANLGLSNKSPDDSQIGATDWSLINVVDIVMM